MNMRRCAEHCLRHALEHDVVKVSSVVSACQGQWPVALDSKLFSDFDLNILYFTFLYFSCACHMQTLFAKDLLHELNVKSFIIHAATLSACSTAQQWLQCLQAGWHPSGIF